MKRHRIFKKLFLTAAIILSCQSLFAGTIYVANLGANSVSVIDEDTLKKIWDLPVGFKPHEVAISPDQQFALVSNFGTLDGIIPGFTLSMIKMSDASIAQTTNLIKGSRPHGIEFISNSLALITAQGIQSLIVEDIYQNIVKVIALPGRGAHCVISDAEKRFAYVANADSGSVVKIDLQDFSVAGELPLGQSAEGLALTQDGELLLVTCSKDNAVAVIRTKDFSLVKKIPTDKGPIRVAAFHNGKSAVVTNSVGGTAQIIDVATLTVTKTFKTTYTTSATNGNVLGNVLPVPNCIAVRGDQKTAYITNMFAGNITLVDLETGTVLKTFEAGVAPDGIAVSEAD